MNDLKNILKSGRILMYGYNDENLPDNINVQDERLHIYSKNPNKLNGKGYENFVRKYDTTKDIGWSKADIVFLDNEAIKGTVVGYPLDSQNVLVALDAPKYWIMLFIGILRRVLLGHVKLKGIQNLITQVMKYKVLHAQAHHTSPSKHCDKNDPNAGARWWDPVQKAVKKFLKKNLNLLD